MAKNIIITESKFLRLFESVSDNLLPFHEHKSS